MHNLNFEIVMIWNAKKFFFQFQMCHNPTNTRRSPSGKKSKFEIGTKWLSLLIPNIPTNLKYWCTVGIDSECFKRGWVANGPDFKCDLKSGSPTIWNQDKWLPFCQKPLEIQTWYWMVQFSNGWDYSHSLNWTIWNPSFQKSGFQRSWGFECQNTLGLNVPN